MQIYKLQEVHSTSSLCSVLKTGEIIEADLEKCRKELIKVGLIVRQNFEPGEEGDKAYKEAIRVLSLFLSVVYYSIIKLLLVRKDQIFFVYNMGVFWSLLLQTKNMIIK